MSESISPRVGIKYYALRAEPFGFAQNKLHERKPSTVKALFGQVVIQGTKYLLALDPCLINERLLRPLRL